MRQRWLLDDLPENLCCHHCGSPLLLILQADATVVATTDIRILYVLACMKVECHKSSNGWRVFRAQKSNVSLNVTPAASQPETALDLHAVTVDQSPLVWDTEENDDIDIDALLSQRDAQTQKQQTEQQSKAKKKKSKQKQKKNIVSALQQTETNEATVPCEQQHSLNNFIAYYLDIFPEPYDNEVNLQHEMELLEQYRQTQQGFVCVVCECLF